MPFKKIELLFLPMQAPRFALFLNLAHPNSDLRWAQSLYWHGLKNGIAYKDHDELLRLWIVSAQTSTVEELGCEFRHTLLSGRPMAALGQTLQTNSALAQPFVRYPPIATEHIATQRTTLCAMYGRRPRCKGKLGHFSEAFGCSHVFGL
jgi:hypothetical protein